MLPLTKEQDWILHDPLLVQTLPLWVEKLTEPLCIFYFSSPLHCADQLQKTWRFPIAFGLALWEYFVLTAAKNLPDNGFLIAELAVQSNPQQYLSPVLKKLKITPPSDWSAFSAPDREPLAALTKFSTQTLDTLHQTLLAGDIQALKRHSLSAESHDILEYYGNLRAGLEAVTHERDKLRVQVVTAQANGTSAHNQQSRREASSGESHG